MAKKTSAKITPKRGDERKVVMMLLLGLLIGGVVFFVGWVMGNITAFLYIRHCCATGIYKTKKEIYGRAKNVLEDVEKWKKIMVSEVIYYH